METSKFIKNKEDFICENCGFEVKGNGYTNHCPRCLYSKHVDINPGDRGADCLGLMEPTQTFRKDGKDYISFICKKCGHKKNNKLDKGDDFDVYIKITKKMNDKR